MRLGVILAIVCAALGLFGAGLLAAVVWLLAANAGTDPEAARSLALLLAGAGVLAFAAAAAAAYVLLHVRIERPLATLARRAHTLAHARAV